MLRCGVAFARWDPFRDLIAIQHRIERLSAAGPHGWAPAVDLCETAEAFDAAFFAAMQESGPKLIEVVLG